MDGIGYRVSAWIAVGSVYVLLRINLVDIPLDRDEGLFGYIGQVIRDGGLPYRDVIDHKPPLVHFLYALVTALVRPEATPIHVFLHAYNFLSLLACYYLGKVVTASRSAGLWTALVFAVVSSLPSLQGFTASTEMILLLPAVLGLVFAVQASKRPHWARHVLSGVMGGLTVLIKPSGLLLAVFAAGTIGAFALQEPGSWRQRVKAFVRRGFAWTSGFLAPLAVVVVYFHHHHSFDLLVQWVVEYNIDYASQPQRMGIGDSFEFMFKVVCKDALPAVLIALGTVLVLLLRRDRLGFFLGAFVCCSLIATIPVAYSHYIAQMVPAAALAAGVGLASLCAWLPKRSSRVATTVALGALLAAYPVLSNPVYYVTGNPDVLNHLLYGDNPFAEAKPVADFVAARTDSTDRVFVLGSEAEILFQAGRMDSSGFAVKYPLTAQWSRRRENHQDTVMVALSTRPPKYILVVNHHGSLLWDGRSSFPLYAYVESLTKSRYALEAIQPIANPRADLIHGASGAEALATAAFRRKDAILIYRRL
jgi:hypothetical protein